MAITGRNTLKGWFLRGMKPLASQFADWIDSFWHKEEPIPMQSIQGLNQAMDSKLDALSFNGHLGSLYELIEALQRGSSIILFIEKIGINSIIYPKRFRYKAGLTVANVILSDSAAGASFSVGGESYNEETLVGVTIPSGADLIINDIDIAAGQDTGSLSIIF
jgi:hypothetical protein